MINFDEFIAQHEVTIRLSFFFGVFLLMACWEMKAPKRALTISKLLRWSNNLGLVVLNSIVLRLLFPAAAVGVAAYCVSNGWGFFNLYEVPLLLAIMVSVVVMDLVIYGQHVLVHAVPMLWRLHRVHHADLDYDVTTGARFHPLEIIFSMLIKFSIILILGPPVVAVIIFEVILNAMAMFNHGNVGLPSKLDKILRFAVVTPDMHRVHHSTEYNETNSNYGFNLSLWDRLFGTYIEQPKKGHRDMEIGIPQHRNPNQVAKLAGMLMLPLKGSSNTR